MASMTEILILHGLLPIEQLDVIPRGPAEEEASIRDLLSRGVVTEMQVARARATAAERESVSA